MMNLPKRFDVADFTFHTAFLAVDTPVVVMQQAEDLLGQMANIGGGTFRNFTNGEEINFLDINFTSVKRMYSLKDGAFLVSNQNAFPARSRAESIDSDGDGLVDLIELELGTSLSLADTDDDGFNDLLEYNLRRSGFDPLDPADADCQLVLDRLDRDGDGLLDCEERFIGTSPELFDTDADGLPDPIEYRAGTNPVWTDADVDKDFDGSLNGGEVAWHTNPIINDAALFSKSAYRYELNRLPGIFESRTCYQFEVDNVSLMGTRERVPDGPIGFNDIMVYAGQVPQDDPEDYGTFRVACARVRYIPRYPEPDIKIPPSGQVKFEEKDFKRPVATACSSDEECPHHICDPADNMCLAPLGEPCDLENPCPNFKCTGDIAAGEGVCEYPVQVSCVSDTDCPPYPVDPVSELCMDGLQTPPDALTGLCPTRACVPQYFTCTDASSCPDDGDDIFENNAECLNKFCRVPCLDAGSCNPGETCDDDSVVEYGSCEEATVATDCLAGQTCVDGACRTSCLISADCPHPTNTCEQDVCVSRHCVNHQGGTCAGVPCGADSDCLLQPCDLEVGRCRQQPCLDSSQCPHQHCEPVVGSCTGPTCEEDLDCRGERGFTCNAMVGDPCDRDIDCPYDFCNTEMRECFYGGQECGVNTDCPPNSCIDDQCSLSPSVTCASDLDCSLNYCKSTFVCENELDRVCTMSLDCSQTFCRSDGVCINNTSVSCNPLTENIDNQCQVGMCARENGTGVCDSVDQEPCQTETDCPFYRCNLSLNLCYYPVEVACTTNADCPEVGMECDATGFCIKRCNSDSECPHMRCQGKCVPAEESEHLRCTDWFEAERDCVVYD
jgi:hypothetical protein